MDHLQAIAECRGFGTSQSAEIHPLAQRHLAADACRRGMGPRPARLLLGDHVPHRISYGPIEAFNKQIARRIHRSYGISDFVYLCFKMRAGWRREQ